VPCCTSLPDVRAVANAGCECQFDGIGSATLPSLPTDIAIMSEMRPYRATRVPNVLSIAGSDPCGGAAIHVVPPDFVARQIDVIFEDIEVTAVKIGMLATVEAAEVVADDSARPSPDMEKH
jgi:hypothetical protein